MRWEAYEKGRTMSWGVGLCYQCPPGACINRKREDLSNSPPEKVLGLSYLHSGTEEGTAAQQGCKNSNLLQSRCALSWL